MLQSIVCKVQSLSTDLNTKFVELSANELNTKFVELSANEI